MAHSNEIKRFYSELYHKIAAKEIVADEFVNFANRNKTDNPDDNPSGFFKLCSKFVDISLNAKKYPDPTTCDVQAVFLYSDVNAAKEAFKEYTTDHMLSDIDGILEAIRIMHVLMRRNAVCLYLWLYSMSSDKIISYNNRKSGYFQNFSSKKIPSCFLHLPVL